MNTQIKSLILMVVLGGCVISLHKYMNREKNISVKVINTNNYSTTYDNKTLEKLDGITSASVMPQRFVQKYKANGFTDSKKKKALFVIGDPRKNSVMYDMGTTAIKWFEENGMEVEVRDLYRMNWVPVLHPDEFYYQKDGIGTPSEDVKKEQELVTKADYIIFVYPNWHDTPTAIVKGYQERVFAKKFAYQSTKNGLEGMLKGKGLFTIMNCGYLGGGRGYVGDGRNKDTSTWDKYMTAYKILDDDQAAWWGMENYGRFVNDIYPKNGSQNYEKELEDLRSDLRKYLEKKFK